MEKDQRIALSDDQRQLAIHRADGGHGQALRVIRLSTHVIQRVLVREG